jgi:anaerobic selenocysteine-containing dehydrogenase
VVVGSNPLVQWPGVARLREAFDALELLVVSDLFLTETARQADLVLPATLPVERDELWDAQSLWIEPRLGLSPRATAPGDILTDVEFWSRLAHALGHGQQFPWSDDAGALDVRLSPLGLTRDDLAARPEGVPYGEQRERTFEAGGFRTPSGKVELASSVLEEQGFDPLPTQALGAVPDDDPAHPVLLSTGARVVGYTHSRYRTIPSLRRLAPEPVLELSPASATAAGVSTGDVAVVSSALGEVRLRVDADAELPAGVAVAPHGWESANVNLLTSADPRDLDPVSGFPAFRSLRVAVARAEDQEMPPVTEQPRQVTPTAP